MLTWKRLSSGEKADREVLFATDTLINHSLGALLVFLANALE
jgi:hypothetical protein